jgi:AraC-like DNA-binding protein
VNHSGVVVVKPPRFSHSVRSITKFYDDMALLPTEEFVRSTGASLGFSSLDVENFLSHCQQVRRSLWLDQLLEQYFMRRHASAAESELAFFERELLRELFILATGSSQVSEAGAFLSSSLRHVLERIEARLFEPLSLADLAAVGGMSRSTLLRHFAQHLGTSPPEYIRARRLDEARVLLNGSDQKVAEVAALVGYRDVSAFSRAYRKRFGETPRAADRKRV